MRKKSSDVSYILFLISSLLPGMLPGNSEVPIQVKMVSATTAIGHQDTLMVGVEFLIAEGWKIYAPQKDIHNSTDRHPQFKWHNQENIKNVSQTWPKSQQIKENNDLIPVYKNKVILPFALDIISPQKAAVLSGTVQFIACSTLCYPVEREISLQIPAGESLSTAYAEDILQSSISSLDNDLGKSPSLWLKILVAFLGGFILNFMPCVLPVISLKLRSIIHQKSSVRPSSHILNYLFTIIGIICSFLAFASIAVSLQSSGRVFGWGLHFQEPLFIAFMCLIMLLFAVSLWGNYEIRTPYFIQKNINRLLGLNAINTNLALEGFVSGVFATLLATPCTAPLLGSALGYALSQESWQTFLLFFMMGTGFSAPYILAIFIPVKYLPLPKPGLWMTHFSKILAAGLVITAVWLFWILCQLKDLATGLSVGLLLSLSVFLWIKQPPRLWLRILAVILVASAVSVIIFKEDQASPAFKESGETSVWKPFSFETLARALKDDKVILVDVTASWCTTCQVNKAMVLNRPAIQALLKLPNVIPLRADWTHHDEKIGQYIAAQNRFGIPFNIVYGPKARQGIILPELLTEENVINALRQAGLQD